MYSTVYWMARAYPSVVRGLVARGLVGYASCLIRRQCALNVAYPSVSIMSTLAIFQTSRHGSTDSLHGGVLTWGRFRLMLHTAGLGSAERLHSPRWLWFFLL
jgi:hypothetical protein